MLSSAQRRVALFAVDEAHCIVEWGNEFRPVYRELGRFREQLGHPLTIALTGSATPAARQEIRGVLGLGGAADVLASFDRANLHFAIERVRDDVARFARLRALLDGDGTSIVYAPTRRLTEVVTRALLRVGARAGPYHAGLPPRTRRAMLDDFLGGSLRLVVATSAFGMGIDKPDVRRVLHWGPPRSVEGYYQEAGRGGRDGGPASCRILWRPQDLRWNDLTPGMRNYLLGRTCRRRALLAYFGERLERCSGCDVCRRVGLR
jgi:ATP-dependent DNA helicase RecQ